MSGHVLPDTASRQRVSTRETQNRQFNAHEKKNLMNSDPREGCCCRYLYHVNLLPYNVGLELGDPSLVDKWWLSCGLGRAVPEYFNRLGIEGSCA